MSEDLDFKIKINEDTSKAKVNNPQNYGAYQAVNQQNPQNPASNNAYQQNFEAVQSNFDLSKSSHPLACIFTFLFKVIGITGYLFLNIVLNNEIMVFIIVVLAAAFDFWTVKNVTGRLLVGLRWWSDFKEDGEEVWYFESYDEQVQLNPVDKRFFWWSQYIAIGFWAVVSFLDILGLKLYWGTAAIICLVLSFVNMWGYYKCSKEHQKKMSDLKTAGGLNVAMFMAKQFIPK